MDLLDQLAQDATVLLAHQAHGAAGDDWKETAVKYANTPLSPARAVRPTRWMYWFRVPGMWQLITCPWLSAHLRHCLQSNRVHVGDVEAARGKVCHDEEVQRARAEPRQHVQALSGAVSDLASTARHAPRPGTGCRAARRP